MFSFAFHLHLLRLFSLHTMFLFDDQKKNWFFFFFFETRYYHGNPFEHSHLEHRFNQVLVVLKNLWNIQYRWTHLLTFNNHRAQTNYYKTNSASDFPNCQTTTCVLQFNCLCLDANTVIIRYYSSFSVM